MKIIYVGLEGSGKSLRMAEEVLHIIFRNANWFKQTQVERPIWINTPLSRETMKTAQDLHVPIHYWVNLDELVGLEGADLFMDEIGTYFDARNYAELSLNVRRWFAQADKSGVDIYGTAQDFAQIDVSFRRLVNHIYKIWKIAGSRRPHRTKPKPFFTKIWGICFQRELDGKPTEVGDYTYLNNFFIDIWLGFFTIKKKFCDAYDTGAFVKMSKGVPLQHNERLCSDCGFQKVFHS